MKLFVQLILVTGLLFSCKTTEEVIPTEESNDSTTTEVAPVPATELETVEQADTTKERTFFASIKRTPCYGTCPTYEMTIYTDGFVEYKGIRGVDLIGSYTTTITQEQLKEFTDMALEIKFLEMEEVYDGPVSDLPSAITTIVIDGTKKQVMRRFEYPKRILQFEVIFDNLLRSEEWTAVEVEENEER